MKTNIGTIDRIIRAVAGVAGLAAGIVLGGPWWIAAAVGAVLAATSAVGFCPIYAPFKISTAGKEGD